MKKGIFDPDAGCRGKFGHETHSAALRVAKRYPGSLVYRCPQCGEYHIGRGIKGRSIRPRPNRAVKKSSKTSGGVLV